jgi:DNA-binding CsgD family transcriptional regulator
MIRRGRGRNAIDKLNTVADALGADLAADRLLICGEFPALLDGWSATAHSHDTDAGVTGQSLRYQMAWSLVNALTSPRHDPETVRVATNGLYGCPQADEDTAPAITAALTALLYAGETDAVRSFADRFVAESVRRRAPVWQARFTALGADAALREGRHVDAIAGAEKALELVPAPIWGVRAAAPISCLAHACLATGDDALARRYLAGALPPALFETRYGPQYLYARGQVNLATGRPRAALTDFLSCGRLVVSWGIDRESLVPWRLAAAGALLVLDDQEGAIELIERRLDQMEAGRPGTVAASNHVEERSAAREHVFNVLATAARRANIPDGIRLILSIDRVDIPAPRAPRYRIEDRYSAYLNKLSRSERQVAVLAARGHSNRDIARALTVSVSTVEQHLTRTYRKLSVAGRNELRARLG